MLDLNLERFLFSCKIKLFWLSWLVDGLFFVSLQAEKLNDKKMMRKLLFLFMMLCCCYEAHAGELDGKYLSQSGELLFIFSGDSLYIDIAQSQRNVSAFKLVKNCENKSTTTFNAFEAYLKDGHETYREVLIKVTKLENKNYLLEYFGKDKDREYNSNERYNIKLID